MTFGNILKNLRQDNNMTQDELAKKIDTSRSNIANYENGKNMPSVDILEKISKLFGVSTDYLLGKSDIRNPEEFKYAYNRPKEADGLSDEEVNDALRLYKKMKKQFGGDNKNEIK